jgi:hypothetical protein
MCSPVLNSWKQIAQYLGRGVRTVERWEKELGLPVRRPRNHPCSAVFAIPTELDEWVRHDRHIVSPDYGRRNNSIAATRKQLAATSRTIHQRTRQLRQVLASMTEFLRQSREPESRRRADFPEVRVMAFDTKTLEELEELAHNLREQIRLHPNHSKLEQVELREVEEWIELRRKNGESERAAAA